MASASKLACLLTSIVGWMDTQVPRALHQLWGLRVGDLQMVADAEFSQVQR